MMKFLWIICLPLFFSGCLPEKFKGEDCIRAYSFIMKDVPYVFINSTAVEYRPYYIFVEQLTAFGFLEGKPEQVFKYDFNYCREHPVITLPLDYNNKEVLWAVNLYDPKELNWKYVNGKLEAFFSIIDHQEPPPLLAAVSDLAGRPDSVPVELRMLISHLEIRLINPPAWMSGLQVWVRNIAATVSADYSLRDTSSIEKQLFFDNQGAGTYRLGVNTFPSYAGEAAVLTISPLGTEMAAPILVEDDRLHLLPGVVTRLDIVYDSQEKITISIEVNGKWEIIDGGNIII